MKVINVIMSLDPVWGGGTAERTLKLSRQMAKMGVETVILTTDMGLNKEYINSIQDVEIVALPCLIKRFYFPKFNYKRIKDLLSEADIVHLMGHWTFINALVYFILRRIKKPYVVCPAGMLPIYGRSHVKKNLFNFFIGNKIITNASGCIAIAKNEIDQFKEYGVPEKEITLIPNGVNAEDFVGDPSIDFREKFSLQGAPFLLFMGRMNAMKGPGLLFEAFANLKDELGGYHLVFAGPDEGMVHVLKEMTIKLSLENMVHFVGHLGRVDKVAAYHGMEILVIPSLKDAMSLVVIEAGIVGKPVLITDQCGFNDVAEVSGGMVVPATVMGIQKGLIEILKDKEKLKTMGCNLKKYVENNFTWQHAADKYLQLFKNILNSPYDPIQ